MALSSEARQNLGQNQIQLGWTETSKNYVERQPVKTRYD